MNNLLKKAESYLNLLCENISERCVGSEGNRRATRFAAEIFHNFGWETDMPEFQAMDWIDGGATLNVAERSFEVLVSPYSLGFEGSGRLVEASTVRKLEQLDARDKIILLHGEIAKEQLMPKGFVFYNPEEHQKIIRLIEESGAKALISATGRNAALAGGVYPFPLIEDGDVNVPSIYMTEEEGEKLLPFVGEIATIRSISERVYGPGYNVIATKGPKDAGKIVISAHIDAKKGTPGAIDNATGVIILFLLAELLKDHHGKHQIELVAFNGEDYYAVSGQMLYVQQNMEQFGNMLININIDGAGYYRGGSAFSYFDLPEKLRATVNSVLKHYPEINEGIQWVQGDHSIFVQFGVPAIAVTSEWFMKSIDDQDITHTPKDNPSIVNITSLVDLAHAIADVIREGFA